MRKVAYDSIEKNLKGGFKDWSTIKNGVRDDMRKHIFSKTKRSPIILPIFLEA
jgi:ribonuclease J